MSDAVVMATRSKARTSPSVSPPLPKKNSGKKPAKKSKGKTKKPAKKPQQQSGSSDVEDESADGSGLSDSDSGDDAQGNGSRGRAGLTDAEVDRELAALADTVADADAAAKNARLRMKQLLDGDSRDTSSAMVTAADAAKKRRADDATAAKQRADRRREFMRIADLLPSESVLPDRPTKHVRFSADASRQRLSRKSQPVTEDSSSDDDFSLVETQANPSVIKKLAAYVQYIAGCTLTLKPPQLPSLRDSAVTFVYASALARVESLMRDRRPVQGAGFTFSDLVLVLERLQTFVSSLFAQNTGHAQDAMFTLVNWTRDLKVEFDAAVESCGSADLVNNHFAPFLNAILSHVPAVFNPVKTARETFATLTQQVANRKGKAILSAMVAPAAPPASASASLASAPTTQQPGGKGTGGGGKSGGRGGGKGKGGGNRPQPIPGPGPPGSFWHHDRQIFVRFVDDPATGRRDNRVCFLCGCGSTPGSKSHRADYCPHKDTPAQHDWVERAIASK
jgi:hypothetical protein